MVPVNAPHTWVLLRGLTRGRHHWGEFPRIFQAGLAGTRLITLDLPGNGDLHDQTSALSIAAMVEQCRAQLNGEDRLPGVGLLAVSMGGMVAVQWAQDYPQEVRCMVLINTSMRPFSPLFERLRPAAAWALVRLLIRRASARTWEKTILALTSHHAGATVLEQWADLRLHQPVRASNALRQLWAAARFKTSTRPPVVSVLVLASRQDQLVGVRCSRRLSEEWSADLEIHDSAGHDLTLDDGPWVTRAVARWLAGAWM